MTTPPAGFEYEADTYHLVFEDPKLAGLEVEACELPVGQILDLMQITDGTQVRMSDASRLVDAFGEALVSWNLTKNGEPVPCNAEGLRTLSTRFVLPLVQAWYEAVLGVGAPLPNASSDGETQTLEASIPTAALPTSLSSSPEPS